MIVVLRSLKFKEVSLRYIFYFPQGNSKVSPSVKGSDL